MTEINLNAMKLLQKGYLQEGEKTWEDIAHRVAKAISDVETDENKKKQYNQEFFNLINDLDFIPSTPCLINAGTESQQLSSCFIGDLRDNIESIYQLKGDMAKIFQKNGGIGFNVSVLRPSKSTVETSKGFSCGTIGFMEEFNITADIVTRNNLRKGAIKCDLNIWHPDIIEFIQCKKDTTKLTFMNISVTISDKFMNAVRNNEDWDLIFPDYSWDKDIYNSEWDGDIDSWQEKGYPIKVYQTIKATELYHLIMEHAWQTGEPGVNFSDNMNIGNPNPRLGKVYRSNPCAEFVSIPWNSCNLASSNLSHMIKDGDVDWDKLRYTVEVGIRFLDDMITANQLPLDKIDTITKSVRSLGFGTMGLADMLYKLKIPYNSQESMDLINNIYSFISHTAIGVSSQLAQEKGCYDEWEGSWWDQIGVKMRNSNLLSIAPNGSISFIANTSGGIEPNFALIYSRRTNNGDLYYITNPVFEAELKARNLYTNDLLQKIASNNGSCQGIPEIPSDMQKVFVVASDLTPQEHLDILAIVQSHVDLSVSKTINLSNSATIEEVEDIYKKAWEKKIKGVTIYRDGSRDNQTLSANRDEPQEIAQPDVQFDSIMPVSRKALGTTNGSTYCKKCACGTLYITINRNNEGKIVECFVHTSKGGICQANIGAVNRMASLSMRSGVKIEEIIDQLKGINCPACVKAKTNGEHIDGLSCPDIMARTLQDFYVNHQTIQQLDTSTAPIKPKSGMSPKCPECGAEIRNEGGCVSCPECGWSKCN